QRAVTTTVANQCKQSLFDIRWFLSTTSRPQPIERRDPGLRGVPVRALLTRHPSPLYGAAEGGSLGVSWPFRGGTMDRLVCGMQDLSRPDARSSKCDHRI